MPPGHRLAPGGGRPRRCRRRTPVAGVVRVVPRQPRPGRRARGHGHRGARAPCRAGEPRRRDSRPRAVDPGVPRDAGQRPGDGTRSPRSSPRRRRRRRGRRPRGQDAGGRHRGRDDGGRSLRAGPAPGRARGGRRRDQGRALHLLDPARAPRRRTAPSRRGRDRARPEPATDRAVGVPAVRALAARHACAPARDARRLGRGRPRRPRRARRQRVGADPHLALVGAGTRRAAPWGRGRRRPPRARLGFSRCGSASPCVCSRPRRRWRSGVG